MVYVDTLKAPQSTVEPFRCERLSIILAKTLFAAGRYGLALTLLLGGLKMAILLNVSQDACFGYLAFETA
jgi:hypothetical protein